MPVVEQREMDPPALWPKPSPAPTSARLDLDGRMNADGKDAPVVTDNIIAIHRQSVLLSTMPSEAMGRYAVFLPSNRESLTRKFSLSIIYSPSEMSAGTFPFQNGFPLESFDE
jgi:hypothetical protein